MAVLSHATQAHPFMPVFLCALRAGSLEQSCKCCKTACLALGRSRCCEWVEVSVCRVQTGVATVPASWQGKPNRLSTERPLVLSLNSSNCIKKLEKQNIIAAVTTHCLPLPLYYRDKSACFAHTSSPLCLPEAVDQQNYWTLGHEYLWRLWNSPYFNTSPLSSTSHHGSATDPSTGLSV